MTASARGSWWGKKKLFFLSRTRFARALETNEMKYKTSVYRLAKRPQGARSARGAGFPFNKNSAFIFGNSTSPMNGTFRLHRPDPSHSAYGYCLQKSCASLLRTTILANRRGHFGLTYRNEQIFQSRPPSKLVPNIPVGPNRNHPFHLMYQPKFPVIFG